MSNDLYQTEVREALAKDTTRLGDVYPLHKKGMSDSEIREKLNTSSIGTYSRLIKTIVGERLLPTVNSKGGLKNLKEDLKRFINRHSKDFSAETIQKLERLATECDRRAKDWPWRSL